MQGDFGYCVRNGEENTILDFAFLYNLIIADTYLRKCRRLRYKSVLKITEIDFFDRSRIFCKDYQVIPDESSTVYLANGVRYIYSE